MYGTQMPQDAMRIAIQSKANIKTVNIRVPKLISNLPQGYSYSAWREYFFSGN
jgi:hypothetical protein